MPTLKTVPDCHFDGASIAFNAWKTFSPHELAKIVGDQQPGDTLEKSEFFHWEARWVDLHELLHATQDGDVPDGGWSQTYLRYLLSDQQAVSAGSPAYAGRAAWIKNEWLADSRIYPLYVVYDWDDEAEKRRLRLLDGHHRLAGAFHYSARQVFALVGSPIMLAPMA